MRYTSDEQRRYAFRDWLRSELQRLDFYQRRGNRYLVSEFARYANQLGARVEEVSLGRYLREENPVLPTPESCRELARALDRHPAEVLMEAGYLTPEDFFYLPTNLNPYEIRRQAQEIDQYTYLPEAIRSQMKHSLERQLQVQQVQGDLAQPTVQPGERTRVEEAETAILPPSVTATAPSAETPASTRTASRRRPSHV